MTPDAHTITKVRLLRARTPPTPWSHVACQTGHNEITLRRMFDPTFQAEALPAVAECLAAPTPERSKRRQGADSTSKARVTVGSGTRFAAVLQAIGHETVTSAAIARKFPAQDDVAVRSSLRDLVAKGLIEAASREHCKYLWRLTAAGLAILERERAR
jgi:hypothetical protein